LFILDFALQTNFFKTIEIGNLTRKGVVTSNRLYEAVFGSRNIGAAQFCEHVMNEAKTAVMFHQKLYNLRN
jgi:hypothetical protein